MMEWFSRSVAPSVRMYGVATICMSSASVAQQDTLLFGARNVPGAATCVDSTAADTVVAGSAVNKGRRKGAAVGMVGRTSGNIEVGGIHGAVPFSMTSGTLLNAYTRGTISTTLLGLPVGVQFDLGTDTPVRGQRQHLRLQFDPQRAADASGWANAQQLNGYAHVVDSLEQEQRAWQRVLIGQQARVAALRGPAGSVPQMPSPPDSLGSAQDQRARQAGHESARDSIRHAALGRADSLERGLTMIAQQLQRIDTSLVAARSAYERQRALSVADADKLSWPVRFVRGIRDLELGTCTPQGSEFLINGITLQGVSFTYVHKDLFLALDHGRSFDDTWRNLDPVGISLRRLQQSLFIVDAQDLHPRRLTAFRVGAGPADGTHLHVGYLFGRRNDVAINGPVELQDPSFRTNHVVEVDAGVAIKKGHLLRIVHARSLVLSSPAVTVEQATRPTVGDLFTESAAMAWKAIWSSDLRRSGTRLEAEARQVSPWFQSFGAGFLRSGSRAVETRVDQQLGGRLRLRMRGTAEQRVLPNSEGEHTMELYRGKAGLDWKASRHVSLNATYVPILTRSDAGGSGGTDCVLANAVVRKRWHRTVVFLSANNGYYRWRTAGASTQQVWHQGGSLTVQQSDRWNVGASYQTQWSASVDSVPTTANIGLQGGYNGPKGTRIHAGIQLPDAQPVAWSCGVQRPVGEHFVLGLRGEQFAQYASLFNVDDPMGYPTDKSWTMSVTYHW